MNSKKELQPEAERLFIYEFLNADAVARKLNLNRKTVNLWRAKYGWDSKKQEFLQSKDTFHSELYEFARKLMRDITADMDSGEKIDAGRMYAFCKIIPMFVKVKSYEDLVAHKDKKAESKGLTPDLIAQIEEEVLGIKPTNNTENDEE